MVLTFGAAYSTEEKSCGMAEKAGRMEHDIDKLNIFILVNTSYITHISG